MTEKQCNKCGNTMSIEDFPYRKKTNSYRTICKKCESIRREGRRRLYPPSDITHKQCKQCGQVLPIDNFGLHPGCPDGYMARCSSCMTEYNREKSAKWSSVHPGYYDKYRVKKAPLIKVCERCGKEYETINPNQKYCAEYCGDKIRKHTNDLSTLTPEQRKQHLSQYYKQWYAVNKDKVAKWNEENKDHVKAKKKEYRKAHKDKYREYNKRRHNQRMIEDIDYRLKVRISEKIRSTINGKKLYNHSIDLLGCSVKEVRDHLERRFQPGMTWDNWGIKGWHIDHIIPISSFNFTDYEQQKRCFHYTNLQPLWWMDNIMKADKIEEQQLILI